MKFLHGYQKDCLMNKLVLLPHLMVEFQNYNAIYDNARIKVKFNGDPLKQNKVTYNHGPMVNIYIVYRLIPSVTLRNCLFGAVKYSGYGIGFDLRESFTHMAEILLSLELI